MTARTMARSPGRLPSALTKLRSILTSDTGRLRSLASDEYPVPKSSTEIARPRSTSRSSACTARSDSATIALSVISSFSRAAGMPACSSRRATQSASSGSMRLRAEMFTDMTTGVPASRHATHCLTAVSRTNRVSWRIRPVCSASGTNSSGGTGPQTTWFQRNSASTPWTCPVAGSACGW